MAPRLRIGPFHWLRRITLRGGQFDTEAARRAAYERVFYGAPDGARVLADILETAGVASDSFSAAGFDLARAAHSDGFRACALQIFQRAGGGQSRLARALALNSMMETRDHEDDVSDDD